MSRRLLVLASDATTTGGVQRLVREVVSVAEERLGREQVELLALHPARGPAVGAGRVDAASKARFAARVVAAARRRPRAVVCMHAGFAPLARAASVLTDAPYAVAAYGIDVWGRLSWAERWGLHGADAIWSISTFTDRQLQAVHGVGDAQLRRWALALPSEFEGPPGRDAEVSRRRGHVLTVARLSRADRYKGVDTLLAAWPAVLRAHPDARLRVVGDGDLRGHLQDLADILGVRGSVDFLGRIDDAALREEYARSTVFALPGRARLGSRPAGEGFGLVFLEAAAAGLPVVAGRAGGAPEAVRDGETALLVDPEDPGDVAQAVVRLLSDSSARARMGAAGAAWVAAERTPRHGRDSIDRLVHDLLERN